MRVYHCFACGSVTIVGHAPVIVAICLERRTEENMPACDMY